MKVITAVVNNPIFIYIQYHTLKKYMKNDYEFIVFNDAKDFPDNTNYGNSNMKNNIEKLKPIYNPYFEEIKQICKKNKINLIAVTTPMCSNVVGIDYFEKVSKMYPEIKAFESYVEGDAYFSSCGHLNDKGARLFTSKVIKEIFIKK